MATGEVATRAADGSSPSWYPQVLDGPFNTRELLRIDEALRTADRSTGLTFSVYVGDLAEPTREEALRLHDRLPDPAHSILLAVSPNQRQLLIVTGDQARRRIPDRFCSLAAMSMSSAFGAGNLANGIVEGLRMLVDQAQSAS